MTSVAVQILLAFVVLEVKHFVADFVVQGRYQFLNKGIYGHPGGLLHSGLHIVGTLFVFLVITPSWPVMLGILVGEFVVHYHIDWVKDFVNRTLQLKPDQNAYWVTFGADQLAHHLTYVAMIAILIANT